MSREIRVKLHAFEEEPAGQIGTVLEYRDELVTVRLDDYFLKEGDDGLREVPLEQVREIWTMPVISP